MNRRTLLQSAGLAGIASLIPFRSSPASQAAVAKLKKGILLPATDCILTPQETSGPFPFDLSTNAAMFRQNITDGFPGIPLQVTFSLVNVNDNCNPIQNARVDIWHCNKDGYYSEFQTTVNGVSQNNAGKTFCRGIQISDNAGKVQFQTIYPGWYTGRATHIHFKVLVDDRNVLTGQLYFPDAINEFLYANIPAYAGRLNPRDVVNANDRFANFRDPNRLSFCAVKEERDCYAVSLVLGIDRFAVAQAGRPPREGSSPELPAAERVRLLIPGFSVK